MVTEGRCALADYTLGQLSPSLVYRRTEIKWKWRHFSVNRFLGRCVDRRRFPLIRLGAEVGQFHLELACQRLDTDLLAPFTERKCRRNRNYVLGLISNNIQLLGISIK